eukprot:GHVU01081276.1.p1 GENE.GHVU01081276.1~~GHVU01081276.1.p1  ORF type:complete len:145 (+),score=16.89 GHVU01081276.1:1118-1552(+)
MDEKDAQYLSRAIDIIVDIHTRARTEYSDSFRSQRGRLVHITPRHFLDFIAGYSATMKTELGDISSLCKRLSSGLAKLVEAAGAVEVMQGDLTEKKAVVEDKSKKVEEIINVVTEKTDKAARRQYESRQAAQQIKIDNEVRTPR